MAQSFKTWIKQYREEDSPVGDLANDMQHDKSFPLGSDKDALESHLLRSGASNGALEAFEEAWQRYKKEVKE